MLIHCNPEASARRLDAVAALVELQDESVWNAFTTVHEAFAGTHVNVLVNLDAEESRDDVEQTSLRPSTPAMVSRILMDVARAVGAHD